MAKSVTVTFEDGTSHTYDNVPDDVTDDQVTQRAGSDFAEKSVTGVVGGIAPASAPQPNEERSMGEKAIAAGQTAVNTLKPVAEFAVRHPIETAAVASYVPGVNQLPGVRDITAARQALYNKYVGAQQTFDALKAPMTSSAPAPAVPEAPPSNTNYLQRMARDAQRYLPTKASIGQMVGRVGQAVAPVARVLGSAPVMGAQLALTPSGLNTNEEAELARRRAMQPSFTFPPQ